MSHRTEFALTSFAAAVLLTLAGCNRPPTEVPTPAPAPAETPAPDATPVPAPGAETDEVLQEYGYAPEEIAALKTTGVVGVDRTAVEQGKGGSK